jgi:hypothetical protein
MILLSVWIAFHGIAIMLAPGPMTYLYQSARPLFLPYWQIFGLGSTWSFYAPDPAPPIFYEWEWEDAAGKRHTGSYPQFPSPYWNGDRQALRITAMGYIFTNQGMAERTFIPYVCRTQPEARGVSLWRVAYPVPSTVDFVKGERKFGLNSQEAVREWISHSLCDRERVR